MHTSLLETFEHDYDLLSQHFDAPLRMISKRSVRVWFNHGRLDRELSDHIFMLGPCELIYAIDVDGRQVSSNVHANSIDESVYGQDLSRRPYAVSLSVLNNTATHGAFLCDAYVSRVSKRPCVTVMHSVASGRSLLGFIGADFDLATLNKEIERQKLAR